KQTHVIPCENDKNYRKELLTGADQCDWGWYFRRFYCLRIDVKRPFSNYCRQLGKRWSYFRISRYYLSLGFQKRKHGVVCTRKRWCSLLSRAYKQTFLRSSQQVRVPHSSS